MEPVRQQVFVKLQPWWELSPNFYDWRDACSTEIDLENETVTSV
jgi:hypothetical protein